MNVTSKQTKQSYCVSIKPTAKTAFNLPFSAKFIILSSSSLLRKMTGKVIIFVSAVAYFSPWRKRIVIKPLVLSYPSISYEIIGPTGSPSPLIAFHNLLYISLRLISAASTVGNSRNTSMNTTRILNKEFIKNSTKHSSSEDSRRSSTTPGFLNHLWTGGNGAHRRPRDKPQTGVRRTGEVARCAL